MTDVFVDIEGIDETALRYDAMAARLDPLPLSQWLQRKAHPWLRSRAAARFAAEGDDAAGKWAELAHTTGLIRHNLGFSAFHPINVRTGRLKQFTLSTYTIDRTVSTATLTMPGRGDRTVENKLRVAQKGGNNAKRGPKSSKYGPNRPTPARPVVALSEFDERVLNASLAHWVLFP